MKKITLFILLTCFSFSSFAQSGFLDDYSMLEEISEGQQAYVSEYFLANGANYHSIMVDLPEVFIHEDSRYRGMKADEMAVWAESFREGLSNELAGAYNIVEEPGEGVAYIRTALVDIYFKKAKRGLFSYTPTGALLHAARNALQDDFTQKISLIALTVEMEAIDSLNGEILGQGIESQGSKGEPANWEAVESIIASWGMRISCRMENTRRDEQVNCQAMTNN